MSARQVSECHRCSSGSPPRVGRMPCHEKPLLSTVVLWYWCPNNAHKRTNKPPRALGSFDRSLQGKRRPNGPVRELCGCAIVRMRCTPHTPGPPRCTRLLRIGHAAHPRLRKGKVNQQKWVLPAKSLRQSRFPANCALQLSCETHEVSNQSCVQVSK